MPDVLALNGIRSLVRLRIPELAIATANDDDDARTGTLDKLALVSGRLAIDRGILDGLEARIKIRLPLPPQETTQNLVRRARRRLEQERLGAVRRHFDVRDGAVTILRGVLET